MSTARDEILEDYRELRSETCVSDECNEECAQEANAKLDAHRAEVLREAATAIESSDYDPGAVEPVNVSAAVFADLLRRMADGESA